MKKSNTLKIIMYIAFLNILAIVSSAQTYSYDMIRETKMNQDGTKQIGSNEDFRSKSEITYKGIDVTIKIDGEVFVVGREKFGSEDTSEETKEYKKVSKYYFPLGKEHSDKTNFYLTEYYDKVNKSRVHLLSYEKDKSTTDFAGIKITTVVQRVLVFINSKEKVQ